MNRLMIFLGSSIWGGVGWWLGGLRGGMMTAFVISSIGTIAGAYVGWRINRDYFE